ncbi:MAG: serine/threonine protein kinase [Desulfurococcaceae archaeon]
MKQRPLELLDDFVKQSKLLIVDGNTYVSKEYASEIGLLKWYVIVVSNLAIRIYPFVLDPRERMAREVNFMKKADKCFKKPEILIIDYTKPRIVRGFVKGEIYGYDSPITIHREIGRSLGLCHESSWVLGDTKITNFVYFENEIYNVDAEQAIKEYSDEYAAWDLLVLVSTLTMEGYLKAIRNNYSRILDAILRGYAETHRESMRVIKLLRSSEFKPLVLLLIPFPLNYVFYRKIGEILEHGY